MAAELLMIEELGCEWCERWDEEIGGIYGKTAEGRRAPLRKVMIHTNLAPAVQLKSPVTYTPTFVLIDNGHEVGRITGYPGEDFFWGYLAELIGKLQKQKQSRIQRPFLNWLKS